MKLQMSAQKEHVNEKNNGKGHAKKAERPWTAHEDATIRATIIQGVSKWSDIAAKLPGRVGMQCQKRWSNHLNPKVRADWSEDAYREWAAKQNTSSLDARANALDWELQRNGGAPEHSASRIGSVSIDCVVCEELLFRPVTLSKCGHTFCSVCIADLCLQKQQNCPLCRAAFASEPLPISNTLWAAVRDVADPTELKQREALLEQKQKLVHQRQAPAPEFTEGPRTNFPSVIDYAMTGLYVVLVVAVVVSLIIELGNFDETHSLASINPTCPRLMENNDGPFCQSQIGSLEVTQQCMEATKAEIESNSWYSTHWLHELAALQRVEACMAGLGRTAAGTVGTTAAGGGS
jgi:hypothetical protein